MPNVVVLFGKWEDPVTTPALLPLVDNQNGDVRMVLEPYGAGSPPEPWVWDTDIVAANKWRPANIPVSYTLGTRPIGLGAGDKGRWIFVTDFGVSGGPLWWNGAAWVSADGAVVP